MSISSGQAVKITKKVSNFSHVSKNSNFRRRSQYMVES